MMTRLRLAVVAIWLLFSGTAVAPANELSPLLERLAALNISRGDYVLGKPLSDDQKKIARRHPLKIDNPRLFKFKDGRLAVVSLKKTGQVIIMYEAYDGVGSQEIQDLVGNLFLDFGKPTVFKHDKVIYWAWDHGGLITSEAFKAAKKKRQPLKVMATVKLNSSTEIMNTKGNHGSGNVYYIISSDPVLKLINQ